jgi:anti-sigma factor ChrR (cupin superfamily)
LKDASANMQLPPPTHRDHAPCSEAELACVSLLNAVPAPDIARVDAHVSSCAHCRSEVATLRPLIGLLAYWPTEMASEPRPSLERRLAERLADEVKHDAPSFGQSWHEPDWKQVAPGIACQLLSNDSVTRMVAMLVRLAPGTDYPAHRHAGVEELHLLDGELWINDRKLRPGDYNRAEPGTRDRRVWSETGCTCFLVTSADDLLG